MDSELRGPIYSVAEAIQSLATEVGSCSILPLCITWNSCSIASSLSKMAPPAPPVAEETVDRPS